MTASFANMEEYDKEEDTSKNNSDELEHQFNKKSAKKNKLSAAFEDAEDYQIFFAKAWAVQGLGVFILTMLQLNQRNTQRRRREKTATRRRQIPEVSLHWLGRVVERRSGRNGT